MLFEEQISRKPNLYPWADEFMETILAGFWTWMKFDFKADYQQFHTELSKVEQGIVTRNVAAIAQIEVAVKTFWPKLGETFRHPAIHDLGLILGYNEVIHNKAYERLLEKLGLEKVIADLLQVPVIGDRVKYLRKYLKKVYKDDQRKQFVYAIILFSLFVENVSLFSQFYTIMWFNREKNVLRDTAQQVQYTRNEETLHAAVGIKLINVLREEYPELFDQELEERIYAETREAFAAESKVIDWIIEDYDSPGLNAAILKDFVADRLNESLVAIGYRPVFDNLNPDNLAASYWMKEETMGANKTDFFHKKPTEYSHGDTIYNEEEVFGPYVD
jgi:ribonucleoside-diphosphate reductase beta chain